MKPRVLIVDDSAAVRADLRGLFTSAGFSTLLCGGLVGARKALAEDRFELIILDVFLQDGDGVDLLRELRAEERTAQVPVLLLSSETAVDARVRGMRGGANDYVGKPYDPAFLLKRARELMGLKPGAADSDPKTAAAVGRRVLVVDDSATFLHAVVEELRKDGHELICASSAEEALPLLKTQPVDCILMDLVLPGMDGISVARFIRADPRLATVPLLMFTARFESQKMADALAVGVDAFCPKGSDLTLLRAQVRNLLRRRAAEAEPAAGPPSPTAAARPRRGSANLLEQLAARSGLSSVIASSTIARACRRAEVDPEHLDARTLTRALPYIRDALRVFLTEHETRRRMVDIESLAREGHPSAALM
jgi:DNA-binding response OmpR family regulator